MQLNSELVHEHGVSPKVSGIIEKQNIANEIFRTPLLHTILWAVFVVPGSLLFGDPLTHIRACSADQKVFFHKIAFISTDLGD